MAPCNKGYIGYLLRSIWDVLNKENEKIREFYNFKKYLENGKKEK